jgi:hypothetical protein
MGSGHRQTYTEQVEKRMRKLREGTAKERKKEMNNYRRYNVGFKEVSERCKEKGRMQG